MAAALFVAATVGACADDPALASPRPAPSLGGAGAPSAAASGLPTSAVGSASALDARAEQVDVRVAYVGGFAPSRLGSVPEASVLADRRVITADRVDGPPRALAPLTVRTLDAAAHRRVQQAAVEAGLADGSYADRPSPDVRSVVISFRHQGKVHRTSFTSLSPQQGDAPSVAERRAEAAEFVAGLHDLEHFVGPEGVGEATRYTPDRVAAAVRSAAQDAARVKDWPAAEVSLAALSRSGACTVLDGPRTAAAVDALTGEDARTLWRQDERVWQVLARPLLPDEMDCRR